MGDNEINPFVVVSVILMLCIGAAFIGITDKSAVDEYAKVEGWTDVKLTGYSFFACSKDDWYHTGFEAKKNGIPIKGTVCSGLLFKGKTLRLQ